MGKEEENTEKKPDTINIKTDLLDKTQISVQKLANQARPGSVDLEPYRRKLIEYVRRLIWFVGGVILFLLLFYAATTIIDRFVEIDDYLAL